MSSIVSTYNAKKKSEQTAQLYLISLISQYFYVFGFIAICSLVSMRAYADGQNIQELDIAITTTVIIIICCIVSSMTTYDPDGNTSGICSLVSFIILFLISISIVIAYNSSDYVRNYINKDLNTFYGASYDTSTNTSSI